MVAASPEGITAAELGKALGTTYSSAYRYSLTLAESGYLDHDGTTGRYRLGLKVLRLSSAFLESQGLRGIASKAMQLLAAETHEAVHLNVADHDDVVLIDRIESSHSVRMHLPIGSLTPIYCSGSGKAMLARLPDARVEALLAKGLKRITPQTIAKPDAFREEIARTRLRGYAIDDREFDSDVRCVAAAIVDPAGHVVGAISCSAPSSRMELSDAVVLGPRLKQAADDIAAALRGDR